MRGRVRVRVAVGDRGDERRAGEADELVGPREQREARVVDDREGHPRRHRLDVLDVQLRLDLVRTGGERGVGMGVQGNAGGGMVNAEAAPDPYRGCR